MTTNPSGVSAPKQVVRGSSVTFEQLFLDNAGNPIVPAVATAYPSFAVLAPDGTTLASGVAISLGEGRYRVSWFVPVDADLSSPDQPYQVQWFILAANGQQIQLSSTFSLTDAVEGNPTERAYTYLTTLGMNERLIIRFFTEQDDISVAITDTGGHILESYTKTELTVVNEKGTVAYYVDTTPATAIGTFLVMWVSRQTSVSPVQTTVQIICVPEPTFWTFQPSMRMFLDKVQKKQGLVQAYSDADIYNYLVNGVGLVNQYNPLTSWSLGGYPVGQGFEQYILMAASWWGLNAQYLSEGELAFQFSGQSVTLDVDRTGYYESGMQRIKDHLDNFLPKSKSTWLRRISVGNAQLRPFNFGLSNMVVRVSNFTGESLNSSGFLTLMSNLGLL